MCVFIYKNWKYIQKHSLTLLLFISIIDSFLISKKKNVFARGFTKIFNFALPPTTFVYGFSVFFFCFYILLIIPWELQKMEKKYKIREVKLDKKAYIRCEFEFTVIRCKHICGVLSVLYMPSKLTIVHLFKIWFIVFVGFYYIFFMLDVPALWLYWI